MSRGVEGRRSPSPSLERIAAVVLGLYLVGTAILSLARGRWTYVNEMHGPVLAPAGAIVGALLVVIALRRA